MLLTPLTCAQRRELISLKNHRDSHPKTRERAEMVLLADAGWTNKQIAAHLDRNESTVQLQIRKYLTQGTEDLGVHYGPRRARKADSAYRELLQTKLDEDRIWTAKQLRDAMTEATGVELSVAHLREILQKMDQSWKRTKKSVAHSRKPEVYHPRKAELVELEKKGV